jgi:hypothetical protein
LKHFASARTMPKNVYGFGIMGCKVTVAKFIAQRS